MIHGIDPRHREQAQALWKARTNHRITLATKTILVALAAAALAVIL